MSSKSKAAKVKASSAACTAHASRAASAADFTSGLLSQLCFVAWTQPGDISPRIGEVHFTPGDFLPPSTHPSQVYCIVYELKPIGKDGCFSFIGGFPFTVLSVACVIPVEVEPVIGGGRSVRIKGWAHVCSNISSIPAFLSAAASFGEVNVDAAVVGLEAWVAAGERLSGWDMSAVPADQRTSRATIDIAYAPLSLKSSVATIEKRFDWRTCICSYFAWAVPNDAALQTLLNLGPLVEIGAGTGYWAWLLTRLGADVIAYDLADSHEGQGYRFKHQLVRNGGSEVLKSSGQRALLLCWPDIVGDDADGDSDRGNFAIESLTAFSGDVVAYVGELGPHVVKAKRGVRNTFPPGGSSASAAFQSFLALNFERTQTVLLPNWPPYNSHLSIWRRRHGQGRTSAKRQRHASS